jgi:hypothetical protein
MLFFMGTHKPDWLERADVPLFVSYRELNKRKRAYEAIVPWALDSGGFTELSQYGHWRTTPKQYACDVKSIMARVPNMQFAAPQDWMCEEEVLQKTRLSVGAHQRFTVDNLVELRLIAPEVPWIPVLQGWTMGDYLDHVEQYARSGIDLRREPLVGLGTICRRQATTRALLIMSWLSDEGLRLHGFGFKAAGLASACQYMVSADSMAWSYDAREKARKAKGNWRCPWGHQHESCANCIDYALDWRARLMKRMHAAGCIDEWESGIRTVGL